MVMQATITNVSDGVGMTATITNGAAITSPPIADDEFSDWQADVSRIAHRIVLAQISHSAGTWYVGSGAYLNHQPPYESYDDWMIGRPIIEDDLDNFRGIGDIEILNLDESRDPMTLFWRGHICRLLLGDDEWPISKFRLLSTSLIDGFRSVGGKRYKIDLLDYGRFLRRSFDSENYTADGGATEVINEILVRAGLPDAAFTNIFELGIDYPVSVEYSADVTADKAIREITDSIGAHMRVGVAGGLEVFAIDRLSDSEITITEDEIVARSVKLDETIPTYANVVVETATEEEAEAATTAATGELSDTMSVKTVLRDLPDAQRRADDLAARHSVPGAVWQVSVIRSLVGLRKGMIAHVESESLSGRGIVRGLRYAPLGSASEIRLEMIN